MRHSVINLTMLAWNHYTLSKYSLDVFALVLISDFDVVTARLQLNADSLAKPLVVGGESEFQGISDVVVQHPFQIAMEVSIDTLHILQRNLLPKNHLVEGSNEECVQETTVEDGQTNNTSNELEIVQVLRVDAGMRIDLEGVVVVRRVFEQTVERVKHLVREQEEEFTRQTSVIQTVFSVELDHQTLLKVRSRLTHDLMVRILEDVRSPDLDVTLPTNDAEGGLRAEVDQLATEITLVLGTFWSRDDGNRGSSQVVVFVL